MRKKISINRFIPRGPLPEALRPDWLESAAVRSCRENDGEATERSLHIAS
jgi:hypothetical protein